MSLAIFVTQPKPQLAVLKRGELARNVQASGRYCRAIQLAERHRVATSERILQPRLWRHAADAGGSARDDVVDVQTPRQTRRATTATEQRA